MGVNNNKLVARIEELKRQKNAVILAHYYTTSEVQAVADFLGDSLALSVKAKEVEAETILFAGVNFMAETAKVLCPEKRVLIPVPEAGCSLAESCEAEKLEAFKRLYPEHLVVSYVNTTVGVKALTDICCTSSNALQVVESIPREQPIIFAPDRNLGGYIKRLTGRDNMVLWDGACHVHERFEVAAIESLRQRYPAAKVVVHPECRSEVVALADYAGSTAGILDFCAKSEATEFIVVTEPGIIVEMERKIEGKKFYAVPSSEGKSCNECDHMKMITLESICSALENLAPEVLLDEQVRRKAERAIHNMIKGSIDK